MYDPAKVFDGTKASTFYNFKWENVVVDGKTNGATICNYVYHLGAGPQTGLTVDNNLVLKTWAEAGLVDTKTFMPSLRSPASDAASGRVGGITTDHYDRDRYAGSAADLGAVEQQNPAE